VAAACITKRGRVKIQGRNYGKNTCRITLQGISSIRGVILEIKCGWIKMGSSFSFVRTV